MRRNNFWLIAAAMLLGVVVVGVSYVSAQPGLRPEPRPNEQGIGRFQVVHVVEREIIILDTVTGDLYAVGPKDIKPFAAKPQLGERRGELRPQPPTSIKEAPVPERLKEDKR